MPAKIVYEGSRTRIFELLASGDEVRIEAMLALYSQYFPEYAHYTARMRRRVVFPMDARLGHMAHYWLIEVDGRPMGISTFRYIQKRNCGIGVSVALDSSSRSVMEGDKRLSAVVISETLKQFAEDQRTMGDSEFLGMVTEVEHRELMEHYKRLGMLELPIHYFEPIFPAQLNGHKPGEPESFKPVILGFMPNPELPLREFDCTSLTDFALAFLVEHYGLPNDHQVVKSVIESISNC